MELAEAIIILRRLASGENPETGEHLAPESVFEEPKVIRALYRGLEELEDLERTQMRRKRIEERRREKDARRGDESLPRNAGRPCDAEGDARLVTLWENGATVNEIAEQMERRSGGIAARLVRLGQVPDRETARTRGRAESDAGVR